MDQKLDYIVAGLIADALASLHTSVGVIDVVFSYGHPMATVSENLIDALVALGVPSRLTNIDVEKMDNWGAWILEVVESLAPSKQ